MARTTLAIDDHVLFRIKNLANKQGRTIQEVTNDLLKSALQQASKRDYQFTMKGWNASLNPAIDLLDRESLFDQMDHEGD